MRHHFRYIARFVVVLSASWVGAVSVQAADINILVGPKGSFAWETAKARAHKTTVFATKSVAKAFKMAGRKISACGDCTVNVKIATGDFFGKAKTGHWQFPEVDAPAARLRIVGGYDETFTHRTPFQNQTRLITAQDRSRPVIHFKGGQVKELYVSGLSFDVAPGNTYDKRNNSLQKGSSSLYPILSFGALITDRLVVADNIFLNGAHTVAQPLINAMSNEAQVLVRNNLIMNTVMAWRVHSPSSKKIIKRYGFENNSFILNWPSNPDPGTANPGTPNFGTLEIGNKYAAKRVDITRNLFAYNAGGAIHAQWDDVKGPPVAITDNLFWGNGSLYGVTDPDMAAVVGKFNGSRGYLALTMDDVEDFEWEVKNNAAFDPKLHVQFKPFLATGSKKVGRAVGAQAAPYVREDYADLGFGKEGNAKVQNYATRLYINGIPPFPTNPDAARYGARADLVEQF